MSHNIVMSMNSAKNFVFSTLVLDINTRLSMELFDLRISQYLYKKIGINGVRLHESE